MMTYRVPRGNVRKLILYLNDIQDLVGMAQGLIHNDRDPGRMDKLAPKIQKAFDLCVEARSLYAPVEATRPAAGAGEKEQG